MRDPTLPALFTIDQFSIWSGLGRTKIYELLSSGALAAIKIGRRTLIRTDSAEAWLAAQTPYFDASGSEG